MSSRKNKTRSKSSTAESLISDRDYGKSVPQAPPIPVHFGPPKQWTDNVLYATLPILSPWLNEKQHKWLRKKPAVVSLSISNEEKSNGNLPVIKLPLSRNDLDSSVLIKRIEQTDHPAYEQFGLFAARKMLPGELVIPYIGYVHSSTTSERRQFEDQMAISNSQSHQQNELSDLQVTVGSWDTSDYDLNLVRDEDLELAIDAAQIGNEARFCNDYRGVPLATTSLSQQTNPAFDRKSKRTAKGWEEHWSHKSEDSANYTQTSSIPNAEFRDVWFEWCSVSDGGDVADLGQEMNALHLAQSVDDAESTATDSSPKLNSTLTRKRRCGMRGVAIFVLPAGKSGKRKHGISQGQEILVSYGKGFWAHH